MQVLLEWFGYTLTICAIILVVAVTIKILFFILPIPSNRRDMF